MAIDRLTRLRNVCAEHDVALFAASGSDALNDDAALSLLTLSLPPAVAASAETVLLITPLSVSVHCAAGVWAGALQSDLSASGDDIATEELEVHVHVPDAAFTDDVQLDFKLEATRAMLERAAREAKVVLAGDGALAAAAARWPLLQAAALHGGLPSALTSPSTATAPSAPLTSALSRAMRSVDGAARRGDGWAGRGVSAVCAGFAALSNKLSHLSDAYDRGEVSEKVRRQLSTSYFFLSRPRDATPCACVRLCRRRSLSMSLLASASREACGSSILCLRR